MMKNKMGPAGYMLSQVLNKRTVDENLQIAKRAYDDMYVIWQYVFDVHMDNSFSESWQIVGVYPTKEEAVKAKFAMIKKLGKAA